MRPAHPIEREVGIEYFVSDAPGMGGRLRERPTDFRVRELEAVDVETLDADPGSYPHLVFRATLAGWDTNDFAARLADSLGISRERVRWAGTKDKRAVTTQLFSVDVESSALPSGIRGAELEPVGRLGRALRFGDLAGNAFEVTVRDADRLGAAGPITRELETFAASGRPADRTGTDESATGPAEGSIARSTPRIEGARVAVPNFFGQQRFGSRRPVTHRVGLAIVRNDWEGAVRAYLGEPRSTEPEDTRAARAMVDEGASWSAVLEGMPRKLGYERAMLHRLVERGDGEPAAFRAALEAVPSTLQRLFVHAAQSYLFNLILSRRLERGLPFDRAVIGDEVCFAARSSGGMANGDGDGAGGDADAEELVLPDPDRNQRVTADRLETVNRHCARGRAFVTAPLVGTETTLGTGEPGRIEREVLESAGVDLADFEGPGAFGSSGTRRAILVPTVLDVDPGAGGPRDAAGDDGVADDPEGEGEGEGEEAVTPTFSFALPRGAYATVLLREYLKVEPTSL